MLPAFGFHPEIGLTEPGLAVWRRLAAEPGLWPAIRLSVVPGLLATVVSLGIAVGLAMAFQGRWLVRHAGAVMAPMIAAPHAAVAIAFAFLASPSGWLARLMSPWLTGWSLPPDVSTVGDRWGLALAAGLVLKETPFLVTMLVAALSHARADARMAVARSLGYGPAMAWLKTVLPLVYPSLRLPILAVLAYGMSVVDMSLVLAPARTPPLSVLVLVWANHADSARWPLAGAAAALQLGLVFAAIAVWLGAERLVATIGRRWIGRGRRRLRPNPLPLAKAVWATFAGLWLAAASALLLWSLAGRWRFPDGLPAAWSLKAWRQSAVLLGDAVSTTLVAGVIAASLSVILAVGWFRFERLSGPRAARAVEGASPICR